MAVFDLMTMRDHLNAGNALLIFRMGAVTVGAFGGLGLLLAAVGIFALVSYSVGQRQREFGIRAALGAQAGDIVMLAAAAGALIRSQSREGPGCRPHAALTGASRDR